MTLGYINDIYIFRLQLSGGSIQKQYETLLYFNYIKLTFFSTHYARQPGLLDYR